MLYVLGIVFNSKEESIFGWFWIFFFFFFVKRDRVKDETDFS